MHATLRLSSHQSINQFKMAHALEPIQDVLHWFNQNVIDGNNLVCNSTPNANITDEMLHNVFDELSQNDGTHIVVLKPIVGEHSLNAKNIDTFCRYISREHNNIMFVIVKMERKTKLEHSKRQFDDLMSILLSQYFGTKINTLDKMMTKDHNIIHSCPFVATFAFNGHILPFTIHVKPVKRSRRCCHSHKNNSNIT